MILVLHIIIALFSIAYSVYLFVSPSIAKLRVMYATVAATLVTGTYLVVTRPVHIAQACTSGLLYLGFVSVGIVYARRQLAVTASK